MCQKSCRATLHNFGDLNVLKCSKEFVGSCKMNRKVGLHFILAQMNGSESKKMDKKYFENDDRISFVNYAKKK